MASFIISDYTTESVTITASGLTSGKTIRFFIRLTDDESDITVDQEFTASGETLEQTFSGLKADTDYTVNIHDGTEWIGAQEFTTEPEPVVDANGRLLNIPVLDSNYPLFDWDDWPDSYAALVSGGLTAEFEKECWNAIVDTLADALETAGIPWDSSYTSTSATRITEEYGDLYAKMMNSLRHNIDRPAPLGWAWANDSSFRGYIGREDFRGVDDYGEVGSDEVYPEYIKELVRKLNLLIEIMRCNGHLRLIRAEEASSSDSYNKAVRMAKATHFRAQELSSSDFYNRAVRRGIAGRLLLDLHLVPTRYTRGFYRGLGKRLLLDNFKVPTVGVNLMRRGIPAYLSTDKSQVVTDTATALLGGIAAIIIHRQSVVVDIEANFLAGKSTLVTHHKSVINDILAQVQGSIGAAVLYRDQTVTDIVTGFRAGKPSLVSTNKPLAFTDQVMRLGQGDGQRIQYHDSSQVTHSQKPFRRGWGEKVKLDPFNVPTIGVNLMRGGVPQYLATNKGLIATDTWTFARAAIPSELIARIVVETASWIETSLGEGLRVYTSKPGSASTANTILREAPPKLVLGRGFSDTELSKAGVREATPAQVVGRGTSDTDTVYAQIGPAPTAPVKGRGVSDTKHSRADVREGTPLRVVGQSESDTGQSQATLRKSKSALTKGQGRSGTSSLGYMALGACMEVEPSEVSTKQEATGGKGMGAVAASAQILQTTSTKISCSSGSTESLEFNPEKVVTQEQAVATEAEGRRITVGSHGGTTAHKPLVIGKGKTVVAEMSPYNVLTSQVKPEAVAGKVIAVVPTSQTFDTDYHSPTVITGFPVYGKFVHEAFSTTEVGAADQAEAVASGAKAHTKMAAHLSLVLSEPVSTSAQDRFDTQSEAEAASGASVNIQHSSRMTSLCKVALGTAWLPPVWVDGGLWIRQAYEITQNEDGSLEVR